MKIWRRICALRIKGKQKDSDEVGLLRRSRPGPTYGIPGVFWDKGMVQMYANGYAEFATAFNSIPLGFFQ